MRAFIPKQFDHFDFIAGLHRLRLAQQFIMRAFDKLLGGGGRERNQR